MEEFTGNIVRSRKKTFPDRNKNLNDFLLWLWVVVVELVFEVLEFSRNEDSRPRIWWIGLAALSHAPFHAAGDHSDPDSDKNTMCRAISTYIPTVRYLAYARDKLFDIVKDEAKLLFAVMPTTPGKKDLQGVTVTDEVGRIFTTVSESSNLQDCTFCVSWGYRYSISLPEPSVPLLNRSK